MANSEYSYVREFESCDKLLPGTYIVCRIDGRSFHAFSDLQNFEKPNDVRAQNLMNHCASQVLEEFKDVVLGYGQSDEYSFLLRISTDLFSRRASKILTSIVSLFSASYAMNWGIYFDAPLKRIPTFDGRIVLYPSSKFVRDYFKWRQADCHINNLYNTTFWMIVLKSQVSEAEAHKQLKGTFSKDKHEILFKHGLNYNSVEAMWRKGSIVVRKGHELSVASNETQHKIKTDSLDVVSDVRSKHQSNYKAKKLQKLLAAKLSLSDGRKSMPLQESSTVVTLHCDIFDDGFWNVKPWLLS